jgi:hypothetical protein
METFLRDTDIQERQAQQHRGLLWGGYIICNLKRFELLVYRTLYEDLKNLISVNQHGFMKNRSTVTNLLEFASFVLNSIEDGWQVDSVYTDFLKAFDRVRHQLLLEKMSVGIEPDRCLWLRSYLTGRIQSIRIGGAVSKDIRVTSGVPQGSHLGPLCFIWFVNRISIQITHNRKGRRGREYLLEKLQSKRQCRCQKMMK